jgi:hypothetical protein
VVHVGDIGQSTAAQGCDDAWLLARREQFRRIRHPFLLLPGDNEWSDCPRPVERLREWRRLFCDLPAVPAPVDLVRQAGEYCEHMRWRLEDTLFVSLNVPGGNNDLRHPEHEARMRAVFAWLDEAERLDPARLVVIMQADPFNTFGSGYDPLKERLARMAARRPGRVVLMHGDTHVYRDDMPLPELRRVEVWGSPFVSWLRASLQGGELRVEQTRQY